MHYFFKVLILLLFANSVAAQTERDTLRVGYTTAPPFIIEEQGQLNGVSVWLWENCAKELGLTYELIPMDFSELLDSLKTGAIDLSINPLTITSNRMESIDFTAAFYASHSIVVKDYLSPLQRLLRFLRSIFSLSFLSGFLVLIFLVFFFGLLVWHFERRENHETFRNSWKGVWDGIWWSVVTMTTVGYGDKAPTSRGGKIIALVWMLTGLLFVSGLTASIASSLTVDRLSADVSDLKAYKDKKVGTITRSSSKEYLDNLFFKKVEVFSNVPDGLDALLEHEIEAFVYDEPILRYRLMNDPEYAELEELPKRFNVQFYAFGLSKRRHEFRAQISKKVVDIIERSKWQDILNEYGCGDKQQ